MAQKAGHLASIFAQHRLVQTGLAVRAAQQRHDQAHCQGLTVNPPLGHASTKQWCIRLDHTNGHWSIYWATATQIFSAEHCLSQEPPWDWRGFGHSGKRNKKARNRPPSSNLPTSTTHRWSIDGVQDPFDLPGIIFDLFSSTASGARTSQLASAVQLMDDIKTSMDVVIGAMPVIAYEDELDIHERAIALASTGNCYEDHELTAILL